MARGDGMPLPVLIFLHSASGGGYNPADDARRRTLSVTRTDAAAASAKYIGCTLHAGQRIASPSPAMTRAGALVVLLRRARRSALRRAHDVELRLLLVAQ